MQKKITKRRVSGSPIENKERKERKETTGKDRKKNPVPRDTLPCRKRKV